MGKEVLYEEDLFGKIVPKLLAISIVYMINYNKNYK